MDKLIDLHIHTKYSDGEKTPAKIVDMIKKSNVSTFAITDHDTVLGIQNLYQTYYEPTLKLIPGIEMTGEINKGRLHILGYGIDPYHQKLNDTLVKLRAFSVKRVQLMIKYIEDKYNIIFPDYELADLYNTIGNVGRPDIAKLCMKYKYVSYIQEAFDKYLIEAYDHIRNKDLKITDKECIELITSSGGIPVLAHPISLKKNYDELDTFVKKLMGYGLQGIEVYHSHHSEKYSNELLELVDKYDLLVSGGSDYHGEIVKPDIMIGSGRNGNVKIKHLSILNKL